MRKMLWLRALSLALLLGLAPAARAGLLGNGFSGNLYDLNPATGAASNPRPTGIDPLVGVAFHPTTGVLYGLSGGEALFRIDPTTGASILVGATGLTNVTEGDLAFDPTTNVLYGLQENTASADNVLFTLNLLTGAATVVGSLPGTGDPSAMAFDSAGTLYVLDTGVTGNSQLLRVSKSTGAILGSTPMNVDLGSTAGMTLDPATGTFFVADGGTSTAATDSLYALDVGTGVLTLRGPTGLVDGLAGLAATPGGPVVVPEPSSLVLLGLGLSSLAGYGWRRRKRAA